MFLGFLAVLGLMMMALASFITGPSKTTVLNSFNVTTLSYYLEEGFDQLYNDFVILNHVVENSGVGLVQADGGADLRARVLYQTNDTVAVMTNPMQKVNIASSDPATWAVQSWAAYIDAITIDDQQIQLNRGPAALADLAAIQRDFQIKNFRKRMNTDYMATTQVSQGVLSLRAILPSSPGADTIHELPAASYTWWANKSITGVGAMSTDGIPNMELFYLQLSGGTGMDEPDLALMGLQVFQLYWNLSDARHRITNSGGKNPVPGSMPFMNVTMKWDPAWVGTDDMCFYASKYLRTFINEKSIEGGEWLRPIDQFASVMPILFRLQTMVLNRRRTGQLSGIS